MCGIIAYISDQLQDIGVGLDLIKHRGPDGVGRYEKRVGNHYIGFGHRRLSIIDLSSDADQPLFSPDRQLCIVFNGEIYNYSDLKRQHLGDYNFSTNSDTEVILALYSRFGVEGIKLLEGMFAFVILDNVKDKIIVCRDQLGIKPLYYSMDNGSLYFASEIKGLDGFKVKGEVDETLIYEYLLSNFIYEPETGFSNIHKIRPGTYIEIDLHRCIDKENWQETVYWRLEKNDVRASLKDEIAHSIKQHLVSDVPIGLFFSGGVDSTILLSELRNSVTSLTIKPDAKQLELAGISNDYEYAIKIAEELKVSQISDIPLEEHKDLGNHLFSALEQVARFNEELIGDFTFLSSRKISAEARKHNLKVALSGMGADEVFAGYPRYIMMRYYKIFNIFSFTGIYRLFKYILSKSKSFEKKLDRFSSFFTETNLIYKYSSLVGYFPNKEIFQLLKPEFFRQDKFDQKVRSYLEDYKNESPLKKAMLIDLKGYLSHNFMVADKSSMLESLELRVPLATPNLYNIAFSMDDSALIHKMKTKRPLKKILEKIIDSKLVNRSKAGFNPPLDTYINSLDGSEILGYMRSGNLFRFINEQKVNEIIFSHSTGKKNNTYKIFSLLYLTAWLKVNS